MNALTNIANPYIQSLVSSALNSSSTNGSASSSIDPSSLTLPQDSNPQLSPFAQVLSTLQQLQQSNPTQYQQVTSQIATNLQSAAQTATADGNTTQAAQLNQLATNFQNASQNNTLPNVQDLAQAVNANSTGAHHHHHHHAASSSSSTTSTDPNSTSSTTSPSNVSNLLNAFVTNSTSATQTSALNPLSIIDSTLTNAGINLA